VTEALIFPALHDLAQPPAHALAQLEQALVRVKILNDLGGGQCGGTVQRMALKVRAKKIEPPVVSGRRAVARRESCSHSGVSATVPAPVDTTVDEDLRSLFV
jgi:hypothetical protein